MSEWMGLLAAAVVSGTVTARLLWLGRRNHRHRMAEIHADYRRKVA